MHFVADATGRRAERGRQMIHLSSHFTANLIADCSNRHEAVGERGYRPMTAERSTPSIQLRRW